jgi:tetratricopeptide (TPR) repeat protein
MTLKFAFYTLLFFVLITFQTKAVEPRKAWNEWMSDGEHLRAAGNYQAAITAFQHALALAETSEKTGAPSLQTLDSLAGTYVDAGQIANAEHEYRQALAGLKAARQKNSLAYAVLLASLASISDEDAHDAETIPVLRKAIAVYGPAGSLKNLFTLRECLAQILIEKKEYAEAETLLLDARNELSKQKDVDQARLCTALNNLGQLRYLQRRFDDALALYRESTMTLKAALGDEHPAVVPALNNLAMNYFQMGHRDDSDKTFQQAATLCGRALGNHPTCGEVYENYAVALRKMGRKQEAKKWKAQSEQIMAAFRRSNGIGSTISVTALGFDKN